MKFRSAQLRILAIFVGSLLINLALTAISYGRGAIYPEDIKDLSIRFLSIYSVSLGIIISGSLGKSASKTRMAPTGVFWVAITLATLWNVLIVGRTVLFVVAKDDRVSLLTDYVQAVASTGSFLIAATLTYFFTTDQQGARHDHQQK